jgi:hypothetical protein
MKFRSLLSFFTLLTILACAPAEPEMSLAEKFKNLDQIILEMQKEGEKMSTELDSVAHFYAYLISNKDSILARNQPTKYRFQGPFSTNLPGVDSSLSSIILLNTTPDRSKALEEVIFTNPIDSVFAHFYRTHPIIAQVYSNSSLQVSRIYPAFDAKNLTDPNLDVREFNFFYEADRKNNPSGKLVWIPDAYIDPAGKGWILSIIHPVYDQDSLSAVVGVDFTVTELIETYLESVEGEFIIVNGKADIVAGKSSAIESLNMPPLKNHVYRETVKSNYFRVSDFNLFNSKSQEVRIMAQRLLQEGDSVFQFLTEPQLNGAVMRPFSEIDWYLIEIFPKQ